MTTQQLYLFNALYLALTVAVAVLTRATARRVAGATAGAAAAGAAAIGVVRLGEGAGWWHMAIAWEPYFLALLWLDGALCGFVFLLTWRVARRFGRGGLAAVALAAAVLGPVRDYRYLDAFPEWGAYAPGPVPALAVSATYVLVLLLGHGVMRWAAGPARADRLARRPWEPAQAGSGPAPRASA